MTEKKSRISKLKVGIATLAIGALLVVPASADQHTDGGTTTLEVTSGDLEATLGNADFGDVPFSTSEQTPEATASISIDDNRGGDGNWHATLEATDLEDDTQSIPASGMTYVDNEPDTGDPDGTVTHRDNVNGLEAEGGAVIADGAGAYGESSWNGNLELTVPGSTLAGNYEGTLTLTAVEGAEPGE